MSSSTCAHVTLPPPSTLALSQATGLPEKAGSRPCPSRPLPPPPGTAGLTDPPQAQEACQTLACPKPGGQHSHEPSLILQG